MDYNELIETYLEQEIDILKRIDVSAVNEVLNLLEAGMKREATIYVFGNGGSAATASHFQNDFNKGVSEHIDKKFRFLCLNDNIATIMAVANDIGYEEVFRFQLQGKIKKGDILMAISGSGNTNHYMREFFHCSLQRNINQCIPLSV